MSKESAPRFIKKPTLTQEDNGTRFVIHGQVEASPKPEIKWFKNSLPLLEYSRIVARLEDKDKYYDVYLEINSISSTDSGTYKCVLTNKLGEASASLGITVTPEAKSQNGVAANFIDKPTIRREGKHYRFECRVKGDPEPTVTWFRNEKQLHDRGKYTINFRKISEALHTYFATLDISDVGNEDAGSYRAEVKNRLGSCSATMKLDFDTYNAEGGKPTTPCFTQKPTINQIKDKVTFECKLVADPAPKVIWEFENIELNSSPKHIQKIVSEDTTHTVTLEIFNITPKDSGEYKVTAKNEHGEAFANIRLNIDSEIINRTPDGVAPNFTSDPKIEQDAQKLIMKVDLESHPRPTVTWFHNDRDIANKTRYNRFIQSIDSKGKNAYTITLRINEPKSVDGGTYKCTASNELGECSLTANLSFE